MRHLLTISALLLGTAAASADTCPAAPDHRAALGALLERIQAAPSAADAAPISAQMWALWADAPDEPAQALLDKAMRQRSSYDYLGALKTLDRLIAYCPDYAEGYNQRAFVNYLREDFDAALPDLDVALSITPNHVGALSGKALTLLGLGQSALAREALAAALALNPWLPERGLAMQGGPLAPPGEDI